MHYKHCQSCGMPLKKDPQKGGTHADGSKSNRFCSYCYKNGQFTQPEISVNEMKKLVKSQMKEMGMPGFLAGFFTRRIPKLERWKNQ